MQLEPNNNNENNQRAESHENEQQQNNSLQGPNSIPVKKNVGLNFINKLRRGLFNAENPNPGREESIQSKK